MKVTLLSGRLTRATSRSAAYDLHSTQDVLLKPGEQVVVGTGVVTEMEGVYAVLYDRSGLAAKFGVHRRAGLIDADYRGQWGVVLVNGGKEGYQVRVGDRIAQAVFYPLVEIPVFAAGGAVDVADAVRGDGGFGSTGK